MPRDALIAQLRRELPGALQEADGRAAILPRSAREVAVALRAAGSLGGKILAPGADPDDGFAVPMDLVRMAEVLSLDATSQIVHAEAGMLLPALEAELHAMELTLGIEGPTPEVALGAWLARGAPGAREVDDDPVDQLVVGLEAVLPDGRELELRPAPRRAVGPDIGATLVGARGRLGIITGAHLTVRRVAPSVVMIFRFSARRDAEAARAWIRGKGVRPFCARVAESDGRALLHLRLRSDGARARVAAAVVEEVVLARGGERVDAAPPAAPPVARPAAPLVAALAQRLDVLRTLGP